MIKKLDEKYLEKLNNFLNEIDSDFPIPLSEKVDLFEFSKKIHKKHTIKTFPEVV